jgi:hypothetical protein
MTLSCKQAARTDTRQLVQSDKTLSFSLDDRTKSSIFALFSYTDKDGKEYLTFKSPDRNTILFYNMPDCSLAFKIHLEQEGSNGVGRTAGYYVHNLDSIFMTVTGAQIIHLIDSGARVKDRFRYAETSDGIPLMPSFGGLSSLYQPLIVIDGKLHLPSCPNRNQDINPLCVIIDLDDKSVHGSDLPFPKFAFAAGKFKSWGSEVDYSRIFDGNSFVYSFHFDEDVYIADINHTAIRKIKAKSRYINHVEYLNDRGATTAEECVNANYGNLIYDQYRDVYYRIAYPKTELDAGTHAMELIHYGRKVFSIIILDKDLNVIGETRFPEYRYNSMLWFVREDGLYISASHFMNPDYSDDWLVFHRFDLVKE